MSYLNSVLTQWMVVTLLIVVGSLNSQAVIAESGQSQNRDKALAANERWESLRFQLFGELQITEDSGEISLEAPKRAFDGARVPITIKALKPQGTKRFIEKLHIIVDNNPMPVAAVFRFESPQDWRSVDTELRINEYSHLRAVAQLSDGSLHMQSAFIKAVGGCSAPPSSYERSDANLLGTFRGGVEQLFNPKAPATARIRLVHPNASGMQFDQFTRTYIPAHYIHTIRAEFNDELLFTVDTNFSLSQDPVLGFDFRPGYNGTLKLSAVDSKNQRFEQTWTITGL